MKTKHIKALLIKVDKETKKETEIKRIRKCKGIFLFKNTKTNLYFITKGKKQSEFLDKEQALSLILDDESTFLNELTNLKFQ